jgi:pimeloyl-ACP methyl ester carboxylesterase
MLPIEKRINYQILGDDTSPKLVFLHGIMGQGRNWLTLAKKFSKDFQCLVYDQRGHGQSWHPDQGFQLGDFAKDLQELLDHLGWQEPIHLVGHSMGGRVALVFADQHPERVKSLVIVDIGASSDWESMQGILDQLEFVPVPFKDRKDARHFMENDFLQKYPNKMVMEFFYSSLVEREGQMDWIFDKNLIRQSLEQSRHRDYWGEFKSLSMPTLFLRGGASKHLEETEFIKVLENNPRIQGWTVEGAGHWVHAEKPLETLRIISDFFNIAGGSKQ